MTLAGLASACVVPLAYEGAEDAGANHIPVIVGSQPAMTEAVAIPAEASMFRVEVEDRDEDDGTWMRVFRLGDVPALAPPVLTATTAGGSARRTLDFSTATFCTNVATGSARYFEVVVADRPFLDAGDPPYRETPGGDSSSKVWDATCP